MERHPATTNYSYVVGSFSISGVQCPARSLSGSSACINQQPQTASQIELTVTHTDTLKGGLMEGGEGGLVDRGIEGELQLLVMALALYFRSLITEYNKTVSAGDSQFPIDKVESRLTRLTTCI